MKITHIDTKRIGIGNYACGDVAGDSKHFFTDCSHGRVITTDGGETWEIQSGKKGHGNFRKLSDGRYVAFNFTNIVVKDFDKDIQKKIPFVLRIMVSDNYEALLEGDVQYQYAVVDIPDLAIGWGDSEDPDIYNAGAMGTGIVETENGDVIIAMYGQFKQDKSKLDYFKKYDFYQYRTWLLVSHDGCKTFEYLSTVADCMTYPVPEAEGYCEPDLLYLGNGKLLCMMRTQGHEVYTPMFRSISEDYGKTWSAPVQVNPYGVLPRLLKMSNGAIVCCSGKWDIFFQVSEDDGDTWSAPIVIAENDGRWDRGPSGYNSIYESDPDTLVVVYDTTEDKVSEDIKVGERRIIYVSRYKIER